MIAATRPLVWSRLIVRTVAVASAALAMGLLALSLIPSATLATRLIGAAGEARSGTYAQELAASLDDRLRFAAVLLLAFAVAFVLLRVELEAMFSACAAVRVGATPSTWQTRLAVGIATVLGAAVRVPFMGQPMRYDEALTFNEFASRPLYYGLSFYPDPNNHLLNTLLEHVAFVAFGNQPWALRLPAFIAGTLLVPATFALAHLLWGRWAGFLAAVLVAVSSYLVEYSTNGRGYTLQALCFVAMMALVVVAAHRRSLAALLAAGLVAAIGAYAVPTMVYGVAVAAVWLLIGHVSWRYVVASGVIVGLLTTVLYLPVIVVSGPDKLVSNRFVVSLGLTELASELPRSLWQTWLFWNRDVPWLVAAALVAGFVLGTWRVRLGLVALGICLACVLIQRVAPFERVWLFLLPLYFTIVAGGLARLVDGRVLAVIFGGVMGAVTLTSGSILSSTETGTFPDAEAVTQTLMPRLAPDDAVMTQLPASLPELQYYFAKRDMPTTVLVRSPDEAQNLWVITPPNGEPAIAGWPSQFEIERYPSATLFELRRDGSAR